MDYLTPELLRVLKPGRIYCCHVKDRIMFGNVTGAGIPTSSPFHADAIHHGHPARVRLPRHGHGGHRRRPREQPDVPARVERAVQGRHEDGCRQPGVRAAVPQAADGPVPKSYADVPVTKSKDDYTRARWQVDAHAFWRSSGDRHLTPDDLAGLGPDVLAKLFTEHTLKGVYDYESHVRIGAELDGRGHLPSTFMALAPGSHDPMVWHDVSRMRTLNGEQSKRGLTQHICPLQIDIVDRLVNRFSNPGDLVLDPFSGLGTVPVRALALGRRGLGVELNGGYFLDAVKYLEAEQRKQDMPTLFDLLPGEADLKDAA
jgi:hypothetical protein